MATEVRDVSPNDPPLSPSQARTKLQEHPRPDADEMHKRNEHILNPMKASNLSASLAAAAKDLEKHLTADRLDRRLHSRPDRDSLEKNHYLNAGVAPQLQGVQRRLQRRLSADEVQHRLGRRPDQQFLKDHGISHGEERVAASLQSTQERLQRQMNADKVHHALERRPSLGDLNAQGVMDETDAHLAPSLQAPRHQLERNMAANQVEKTLRKRPSVGELEERGIVEHGEIGGEGMTQLDLTSLALKATQRIAADNLISEEEKQKLKDLILSDDEKVVGALEAYKYDDNLHELLDTLYRLAKMDK